MAFSSILFVSNNVSEFHPLISTLENSNIIQEVDNLDSGLDKQQELDENSLTIIDSELIPNHDAIASITEKIVGKIILFGSSWTELEQINAIASGVSGYCDQGIKPALFSRVLESVLNGEVWIPRHLIPKVINLLIEKNFDLLSTRDDPELLLIQKGKFASLSEREEQVAMLIADGKGNKLIAAILCITERTVKAHLSNIFQKLEIPDRIHLVIFIKNLLSYR